MESFSVTKTKRELWNGVARYWKEVRASFPYIEKILGLFKAKFNLCKRAELKLVSYY